MKLADAEERAILEQLAEGVLLLDANGEIAFANEAFRRAFSLDAVVVRQKLDAVLPDPALTQLIAAATRGGEPGKIEFVLETEPKRWLEVRARRLGDATEARVLLLFRDITAQRKLEEIGADFVANVSHELRTPVSIVTGYIENLADFPEMPRAEQLEVFAIMQEHATRLKALLDDLLTLACFESRSEVLDYAELDLAEFFRRLAKDWEPALASKEMAFVLELPDDVPTLWVDRFRFEQVMHNLFDNAFKYTPLEGQIRVRVVGGPDRVELSVEDNGAGIPEEDLPHVFERFYRVDKARSRKYGGTGLGLSIVKHIVTLHGGTVRAESTLQMSTRIIITLPRGPR